MVIEPHTIDTISEPIPTDIQARGKKAVKLPIPSGTINEFTMMNWVYALTSAVRLVNHRPIGESAGSKRERMELAAKIIASDELARKMLTDDPSQLNKAAVAGIWKQFRDEAERALMKRGIRN